MPKGTGGKVNTNASLASMAGRVCSNRSADKSSEILKLLENKSKANNRRTDLRSAAHRIKRLELHLKRAAGGSSSANYVTAVQGLSCWQDCAVTRRGLPSQLTPGDASHQ